jgi:hypothetical protein
VFQGEAENHQGAEDSQTPPPDRREVGGHGVDHGAGHDQRGARHVGKDGTDDPGQQENTHDDV